MALPTKTITWDNINSASTSHFEKVVVDNFFDRNVFLKRLKEKARTYPGGIDITEPLMYGEGTATDYSGTQTLNIQEVQIVTTARFTPGHYTTPVTISKTDILDNSGDAQVFDLLRAKIQNAGETLSRKLTADLVGSQTAAPKLIGLGTCCPTSANTYGGIDATATDMAWWDNARKDYVALANLSMATMQSQWGAITDGDIRPTIILATQAIYDKIWEKADAKQRLGVASMWELGVNNIEFNGVPVIVDKNATAGSLLMLNENFLHLRIHQDDNLVWTPWLQPTDAHVKVKHLSITLQLTCSNRRYQSIGYNLT